MANRLFVGFSLLVLALVCVVARSTTTTCRPPIYCGRTDRNTTQETFLALPEIGQVITDPDFDTQMMRVTDANTRPKFPNSGYKTPSSSEENPWSADGRHFYVLGDGNAVLLYSFDEATMQASPVQVPGTGYIDFYGNPTFSFQQSNLIYGWGATFAQLQSFNLTTLRYANIVNFSDCINRFAPAGKHVSDVSVSVDDQRIAGYIGGIAQHRDMYAVVYDKNLGCRWFNTLTGDIGGSWGVQGTSTYRGIAGKGFTIHQAVITPGGDWFGITSDTETTKIFWNIATLDVVSCAVTAPPYCGGHQVTGFHEWLHPAERYDGYDILEVPYTDLSKATQLVTASYEVPLSFDKHFTWADNIAKVAPADTAPVCSTNYDQNTTDTTTITGPLQREIVCIRTDHVQAEVWRFGHHRSIFNGDFWSTPRGNLSQDGKFMMFTTDWDNRTGLQTGSKTLYREDVFIVHLYGNSPVSATVQ